MLATNCSKARPDQRPSSGGACRTRAARKFEEDHEHCIHEPSPRGCCFDRLDIRCVARRRRRAAAGTGPAQRRGRRRRGSDQRRSLGAVDLGKEINVEGRQLRTRRLVVQPGGIVPLHSHAGRPALIYVVSGQITENRSSCAVPILHKAGDVAREADSISHYWVNKGKVPAVLLSSDVHKGN